MRYRTTVKAAIIGSMLSAGGSPGVLGAGRPANGYFPPPESEGGWRELEKPEDIRGLGGMDPAKLAGLKDWLLKSDKRGFAADVIRHGYIVLEVERGNSAKTDARRVASVSKAICATVLAIASEQSQQGLMPRRMTFNDPAFDFIPWAKPLSDPRKARITVKQLLNHTSGITPEATGARNEGPWRHVLGYDGDPKTAQLAFDPGTACGYSTFALYHAALVCENVTGIPYDQFAIQSLFKPLGCEHWWFQYFEGGGKDGDKRYGRHPSHAMGMPARDLARIAYCMLHDGRWRGRQVIPKWFVKETAAPTHNVKTKELRFKLNAQTFSHGWQLPARLDGARGRGFPRDARYKPGSGGQLIAFVPSLDLVVTRQTGGSGGWEFEEYLRRACACVIGDAHKTSPAKSSARLHFKHHFGDRDLGGDAWGQTALADIDRDGDLDFITGRRGGPVDWYEYQRADQWLRHDLGEKSPSDVGGAALDVNGDGWIDFLAGGVWYENPHKPREQPFRRHVFDGNLRGIHDVVTGDANGDGKPDVFTMSDRNDLRWYSIPPDPTRPWMPTRIGESTHSGISAGDIDGDGDLDVVRSNVWFENQDRGARWSMHRMTRPWGRCGGKVWERNATQTRTADINGDGRLDVVISDGESRGARIAWLEAPEDPRRGPWTTHLLPRGDRAARGAFHSLAIADFNLDGKLDIFTVEMEAVSGERPPRWFVWEAVDGRGDGKFVERVILDANLGGHEAVVGDVDGDGDLDICSKPWRAKRDNANAGRNHFDYLENMAR